jgi:hypothetical protein
MVNSLTTKVGATFAPIILETLVKHYFERLKKDLPKGKSTNQLRQDELLYDQAFNVVKVIFMIIFMGVSKLIRVSELPCRCVTVSYLITQSASYN